MIIFRTIFTVLIFVFVAVQMEAQTERFSLIDEQNTPLFSDAPKTQPAPQAPIPVNFLEIELIPKAYCYDDLAVFCKLEVQLEKTFRFPIKIRLGEVNYVEMLEGKPYSSMLNGRWMGY